MKPSRLAEWLVRHAAPALDRDALCDDLAEEFARRAAHDRSAAARWYRGQVRRSLGPLVRARLAGLLAALPNSRDIPWREASRWAVRHPRIASLCVVTLALAAGAALAAGTLVYTVLLRGLPFPSGDRIVVLWNVGPELAVAVRGAAFQDLEDWRDRTTTLDAVSGETPVRLTLTGRGEPRRLDGARVARDFDRVLGVSPAAGRLFEPRDFLAGAHYVVVLTHGFWQREFGASPHAIGQTLTLDDRGYRIVGVLPPSPTSFPAYPHDLWVPLIARPGVFWENSRATAWLSAVGRLGPTVSVDAARAELSAIARALSAEHPGTNGQRIGMEVRRLRDWMVRDTSRAFALLACAVAAVLLVAWANLLNLLLTHATTRRHEFAVRLAIGAGRLQIVGQIVIEGLMLAGTGVAIGLALAPALLKAFVALYPGTLWRAGELEIGPVAAGGGLLLAILGAAVLALPQARLLVSRSLAGELRQGARVASSRGEQRARTALVAAQVAFCVVLLAGGVLFVRTFVGLARVDPGFRPDGVLVFGLSPSPGRFGGAAQTLAFFEQALDAMRALPGVRQVAAGTTVPFFDGGWQFPLKRADGGDARTVVTVAVVSPGYFEALGARVIEGRTFDAAEHAPGGPPAVMVNDTLARLLPPGAGGRAIDYDGIRPIVGVVAGMRERLGEPPAPGLYMPWHQAGRASQFIVVRTGEDPIALQPAIAARIHAIDPAAPIANPQRLRDVVDRSLGGERFRATLLTALGATALLLAALGVYSLTTFTLALEARENGIRRALGEPPAGAARRTVARAVGPAIVGAAAGAAIVVFAAPALEGFVYGVSARDPRLVAGVMGALVALAALACLPPARAAMRADATATLKRE